MVERVFGTSEMAAQMCRTLHGATGPLAVMLASVHCISSSLSQHTKMVKHQHEEAEFIFSLSHVAPYIGEGTETAVKF